ncbi:MAG: SPOR domain-containing protein [Rhodothermaceae bacterium]|nr:SPOR domain-containing protein [Rhodothermaceae bacterium]
MDKVSHIQFVEDLAAKLGLTEEETVKKLTELILIIKMESESGKMIIDGLGIFTTKGKILTFIPDESFELEINHNYAGMMPVEIEEPKPGTAASSAKTQKEDDNTEESDAVTDDFEEEEFVDVIDEQDPFDLDDDETGTESTSSSKSTGEKSGDYTSDAAEKARKAALEAEEQKIKEDEEEQEEAARKAELEAQAEEKKKEDATAALAARKAGESEKARAEAGKVKALEKEAAEKKKAESKERAETASEKSADKLSGSRAATDEEIRPEWVEPEAETAQKVRSDGKKPAIKEIPAYDRARPDSNTGTIIAILVAAVVVVAGALYLFGFLTVSEPATTTSPVISEQTEVPPASTDLPGIEDTETGISATEQLAQEEAARDVTAQPAPAVDDQPAAPSAETQQTPAPVRETAAPAASYGLRGTMNTTMARPYTIVVHSLTSRTDAEREAAVVAEAGYRSTWFRVELPNGSVRWRVSIGQFASSDAAVEAARQLPEPYSANNFISRIESYNP